MDMMTPINRIPQLDSELPLNALIAGEMKNDNPEIGDMLRELADHARGNQEHLSCTMDWAMQIRDELGIDWGNAIEVAMTLYFG